MNVNQQLWHLKTSLDKTWLSLVNRKRVVLHHDNACPHTAQLTKDLWEDLSWEKLLHPPYSADLILSDLSLVHRFAKPFGWLKADIREGIERELASYFTSKPKKKLQMKLLQTFWQMEWGSKKQWRTYWWLDIYISLSICICNIQ